MSVNKPMNLLLIVSDEHNRNFLGCHGNGFVKTPVLDSLCESGADFPKAYCNCPICLPSRASFTIGDYPSKNGYWDNAFPYGGEARGFGHRISESGFPVVTVGKLHFKDDSPSTGFPDQRLPLNAKDGIGDYFSSVRSYAQFRPELGEHIAKAGWGDSDYLRYDKGVADEAERFIREEAPESDKPWLLKVGFILPHFPLIAPSKWRETFPEDAVPFPKKYSLNERPSHPILNEMRRYMDIEGEFSDEQVKRAVSVYSALCAQLDENIGQVLSALKETGQDRETRIIYISDHGDMMGAHGLWWKHTFYEESVGVPFMISGPDIPAGRVSKTPVSLLDLYPTILDCFGLEPDERECDLPGRSLLPEARGEEELPGDRVIYAEYFAASSVTGMYMIRKGEFKLCYYAYYPNQLFDLLNDPDETQDLAGDPRFKPILDDLERELRAIVDPERLSLQARMDQLDKIDEYGGYTKVLNRGELFPYSPVPERFR